MDNLLNVNQVAFILKVHPLTIRRYIREGKLKAVKTVGNVRIRESELTQFNSKEMAPTPKSVFVGKIRKNRALLFTEDDPLLRLRGRVASLLPIK